jgi:hypothetical protein
MESFSPCHTKLRKQKAAATLPDTGSKPAWETLGRPTGEHQASCSIPSATPGINQHSPLGRLTAPTSAKQQQQQKTEQQMRN